MVDKLVPLINLRNSKYGMAIKELFKRNADAPAIDLKNARTFPMILTSPLNVDF